MTDPPTPARRAELRGLPGRDTLTDAELTALLDATEPVGDVEVVWVASELREVGDYERGRCNLIAADRNHNAAALIARLARELAEARGKRVGFDRVARIPFGPPEDEDE